MKKKKLKCYAVEFDGVLANSTNKHSVTKMVNRIKTWHLHGHEIYIFTSKLEPTWNLWYWFRQYKMLKSWCKLNLNFVPKLTFIKLTKFDEIWDCNAISVRVNTGHAVNYTKMGIKKI